MKRILVTGANSYIGSSFERYVKQWPNEYVVDVVDMVGDGWRAADFSRYDTVFHVAGIAHSDIEGISEERKHVYYAVNTDLAIETGQKAKREGVGQFIFMSSMVIFGASAPIGKEKIITRDTMPNPRNFYGDSKLKAEEGLLRLADERFKVVILRPPMIYGKGCKGNYPILSSLARKLPIFPNIANRRSMLYIENLVEFVRLMVQNEERGVYCPQNSEYVNTSALVKAIAAIHGKTIWLVKGLEWAVKLASLFSPKINKAFGSLYYAMELSAYKDNYIVMGFQESVKATES